MIQSKKILIFLIIFVLTIFYSSIAYGAAKAGAADKLVMCDVNGNVNNVTPISGVNLNVQYDTTYFYSTGVDVAIFKTDGTLVKQLGPYNAETIQITFGAVINYDFEQIYTVKYRGHYGVVGTGPDDIVEDWKNSDIYFCVLSIKMLPTVTTGTVTNIAATTATGAGDVTSDGGANVTERGVVYATTANPTTADSKVTSGTGTGAYTSNLTGLSEGTTYYIRAYAINSVGTSYGSEVTFTTIDTTPPTVTFSPDGGTFNGDVTVLITSNDKGSGVAKIQYAWTHDINTPASWTDVIFSPIAATGTTNLSKGTPETWYLHVISTDVLNNQSSETYKTYTITSKASIAVRPSTGVTAEAGKEGRVVLLNKQGKVLKDEIWGHGNSNIYSVLTDNNERIIFAGQDGNFQVRDSLGNWKVASVWGHSGYSIKAMTNLFNTSGNPTGEVLMAGNQGKWQVRNVDGTLNDTKKGTCDIGEITAAAGRGDGRMVLAGSEGKVKIIETDGATIVKEETWMTAQGDWKEDKKDNKKINTMLVLPDNSIIFAGEGGKYQLRDEVGKWKTPGTWSHTGKEIKTFTLLPNGNVLMTGDNGYFQILKIKNNGNTELGTGIEEKGQYMLTNIQAAFPREDGMVVIADSNWKRQYYKYNPDCSLMVTEVTDKSVKLETKWDGVGFENTAVEMSVNGNTWSNAVVDWKHEGTEATMTGLNSGTDYYFRVKTLMSYPIYFISNKIKVTTE